MQKQALKGFAFSGFIVILIIALSSVILDQGTTDGVNSFVESISGWVSSTLTGISTILPIGFAFGAGMIAAVNPCGFVMLPSYVAVYLLSSNDSSETVLPRLVKSFKVTVSMTLGFVAVFGLTGSLISFGMRSIIGSLLPWFGIGVGIVLIVISGLLLFGIKQFTYSSLPFRMSNLMNGFLQNSVRGYFFFGVSYALVSLGCALPIFMVVVTSTFTGQTFISVITSYINYSLGMGTIILIVTASTALLRRSLTFSGGSLGSFLNRATIALLLIAGCYLIFYWFTIGMA